MLPYENTEFFRSTEGNVSRIPAPTSSKRIRHTVSITPFRSLAISTFSFPFSNALKVREALKLQTLPYAPTGEMELFPSMLEKTPRSSGGIVWFVPTEELAGLTPPRQDVENRVWPAPLSLVAEIQGDGGILWQDEENSCSMLWREGVPVLYRWKPRGKTTPEAEQKWLEGYCRSKEETLDAFFAFDATRPSQIDRLPQMIKASLDLYPWIGDVNLSRSALDSAMVLERAVRLGTRVASWIFVFGLLAVAGNGLRYYEMRKNVAEIRTRSSNVYREAFDPSATGLIRDPLRRAQDVVLRTQSGSGEGRLLDDVLSDLGNILEQNPEMSVALDSMRYSPAGIECSGSAPDMQTILAFQEAWKKNVGENGSAQLENIHNVPNAGSRYDLRVRW